MKKALKITLVTLFWIGIWYLAVLIYSSIKGMDLSYNPLFPYPHDVIIRLFKLLLEPSFYLSTVFSLLRIIASTVIATALGVFLNAVLCSVYRLVVSFLSFKEDI